MSLFDFSYIPYNITIYKSNIYLLDKDYLSSKFIQKKIRQRNLDGLRQVKKLKLPSMVGTERAMMVRARR